MLYTPKVIKHFQKPHNQGVIKNADSIGEAGNPICGDVMKIYLKIGDRKGAQIIKDIKFETLGCAAAIAVSSALTDLAKGMELREALELKKEEIIEDLGGLPPAKVHCSMLGLEALKKAIKDYQPKKQ